MQQRLRSIIALALALATVAGCTSPSAAPPASPGGANQPAGAPVASQPNPVDSVQITTPVELNFWHRQTGVSEQLQQSLVDEFTAANPNIKIVPQSFGNYNTLYEKIIASIQAGAAPDMVAAYENQAADYYEAKALVPFDDYMNSTKYGLTKDEQADYIPAFLEATKFPQYEGKHLTFPYTKSDLVLYSNLEALKALGFSKPPATWDEFLAMCRAAVAAGRQGYAAAIDASAFNGIVFSHGGEVVSTDGKKPLFDQPAAVKTLQIYETLGKEKLAYQAQGTDDQNDLMSGKALFIMKSSTSVPVLTAGFKDDSKWSVTIIPQGQTAKPTTVLYGANISIMKSTPQKQLAAWLFIKWLTKPDITARWGLDPSNGYFPVRQSTLQQPSTATFLSANLRFRDALEISRAGKVEPSATGWAEVRNILQDAMTGLLTTKMTAAQAQQDLMQRATKALNS